MPPTSALVQNVKAECRSIDESVTVPAPQYTRAVGRQQRMLRVVPQTAPLPPEAHLCSVQYQLPVLTACDDVKLERHRGGLWTFLLNGMNGWRLRKKVPENVFNLFRSGDWGRGIGVIGGPFDRPP